MAGNSLALGDPYDPSPQPLSPKGRGAFGCRRFDAIAELRDSAEVGAKPKRDSVSVELERLSAEIREVKFTLGTLAGHVREFAGAGDFAQLDSLRLRRSGGLP